MQFKVKSMLDHWKISPLVSTKDLPRWLGILTFMATLVPRGRMCSCAVPDVRQLHGPADCRTSGKKVGPDHSDWHIWQSSSYGFATRGAFVYFQCIFQGHATSKPTLCHVTCVWGRPSCQSQSTGSFFSRCSPDGKHWWFAWDFFQQEAAHLLITIRGHKGKAQWNISPMVWDGNGV